MTYPPPQPDPNRQIRTAGTIALWLWIVIVGLPLVVFAGCALFCLAGGLAGALLPPPPGSP